VGGLGLQPLEHISDLIEIELPHQDLVPLVPLDLVMGIHLLILIFLLMPSDDILPIQEIIQDLVSILIITIIVVHHLVMVVHLTTALLVTPIIHLVLPHRHLTRLDHRPPIDLLPHIAQAPADLDHLIHRDQRGTLMDAMHHNHLLVTEDLVPAKNKE